MNKKYLIGLILIIIFLIIALIFYVIGREGERIQKESAVKCEALPFEVNEIGEEYVTVSYFDILNYPGESEPRILRLRPGEGFKATPVPSGGGEIILESVSLNSATFTIQPASGIKFEHIDYRPKRVLIDSSKNCNIL